MRAQNFFIRKRRTGGKRTLIAYLKDDDGRIVWNHSEKEGILEHHFIGILGSRSDRSSLLDWERLQLPVLDDPDMDRPFTVEEIKNTIKEMPSEKAPGPDGFNGTFYKVCWPIIMDDLMAAVHSFYQLRAGPLEHLNAAYIVLIPKDVVCESAKDFRPISLINSFAKLITKMLAIRLSAHIDKLISKAQSAFIRGRCIQDNFMYVRNLARAYHRTKTPALLFKLDISKAFDTVSWEYLLELLQQRGFSHRWREWLSLLFKSSHSSVMLNGRPGNRISHARGLRQGDPLSPYLFIIAIDTLQRILDTATEDGVLSPLRGRYANLRLSLYADDAVIFLNPVAEEVTALFGILEHFGNATGLRLNMAKCIVAPIRCTGLDLNATLRSFHGQWVSFPIKYLGLPLSMGRLKLVHVQSQHTCYRQSKSPNNLLKTWTGYADVFYGQLMVRYQEGNARSHGLT